MLLNRSLTERSACCIALSLPRRPNREANGKDTDFLKYISTVAWPHINLYGRYNFNTNPESINMDEIILELAKFKILPNMEFPI